MVSVILSSRSLVSSFVLLDLLSVLTLFFISVIVFFSSDCFFFKKLFPSFLLKFSLCSSNLYANSVISLITNDLSSLSGKSFISVSLVSYSGSFSCPFIWSKFLCLLILLSFLYSREIR